MRWERDFSSLVEEWGFSSGGWRREGGGEDGMEKRR